MSLQSLGGSSGNPTEGRCWFMSLRRIPAIGVDLLLRFILIWFFLLYHPAAFPVNLIFDGKASGGISAIWLLTRNTESSYYLFTTVLLPFSYFSRTFLLLTYY